MEKTMQEQLKSIIRDVPDFPKPGIIFKDITPLLAHVALFKKVINTFVARYSNAGITKIVGIESRGFIFGAPLAYQLGCGFVPVRKKGKLPFTTHEVSYDLEYGSATVEMHIDSIEAGDRIVIIDDLLATGGTAKASVQLVEKMGGTIHEIAMVVELAFLNGREVLKNCPVYSMVKY